MQLKGNIGEWSELYAACYLLAEGRLYAADKNFKRQDSYFIIRDLIRYEQASLPHCFKIGTPELGDQIYQSDMVEVFLGETLVANIDRKRFFDVSREIYQAMQASKGRSFAIPAVDEFLAEIHTTKLSASSQVKQDIEMNVRDSVTQTDATRGFSIKSFLGSEPTLLNASRSTNLVYRVEDITPEQKAQINAISTQNKLMDRIQAIKACGKLSFKEYANVVFQENLSFVDTQFHQVLAHLLQLSFEENKRNCVELVEALEALDPMKFNRPGLYRHQFKKFLRAVALGMTPSKPWSGLDHADGGYIIVNRQGDVLGYHFFNADAFEDYLLTHTHLERGSSIRHDYGVIEGESGHYTINLNLQIRFHE